jgi:hypothetical protein
MRGMTWQNVFALVTDHQKQARYENNGSSQKLINMKILLKTTRMWTNAESNLNLMKASIDSMAEQMQLLQGKTSSIAEKLSLAPAVCELIKLENLTTNAVPPTPITSPVFK